jgi:uncharacterized membrane-anchored protein YhcB (DUF1043 family)
MTRLRITLLAGICVLLASYEPARADDSAERARIARERADVEARFQAQRRECETRFAVTACVDEARAGHRQALQRLRREEGVLDEAQRRQRAAARLSAIEEKQRAERERASAPRAERPAAEPLQVRAPRQAASAAARPASAPASAPDRAAEEARKRAAFEARQREAREHREQAEQRRAQREKSGKAAAPLPDPAAR